MRLPLLILLLLAVAWAQDYDHEDLDDDDIPKEVPEITKLRTSTKQKMDEERKGSMDKQLVYLMFRKAYVKQKGLVKLVNDFNQVLAFKHSIRPEEYVQVGWDTVGILVTQISDMMVLKDFGKARKSILLV